MPEPKLTRTVTVTNREGVHARVAMLLAQTVRQFQAKVAFVKDRYRVEATDVLQLLSLGAAEGEQLQVEAVGPDAEAALETLARMFASQFREDASAQRQEQ